MIASLFLPIPPSLNSSYANIPGRGRIATQKLKRWKIEAGWRLNAQKPQRFDGPVAIEISIWRDPKRKTADIDNRIKAIQDILVEHRILKDDRDVMSVKASWVSTQDLDGCKVTISKAEGI